jgi:WD40 repeat protein
VEVLWQRISRKCCFVGLALSLCVVVLPLRSAAQAQEKPYTKDQIIFLLKRDVPPKRVDHLARERGIDFQISPEVETELLQAGATDELLATLREIAPKPPNPAPPEPATLLIESTPGGAQVYVDDDFKGTTGSEGLLRVTPLALGHHRIRLSLQGYRDYEQTLDIASPSTVKLPAHLESTRPEPNPTTPGASGMTKTPQFVLQRTLRSDGPVFGIAFSPDGRSLASTGLSTRNVKKQKLAAASGESPVKLWDVSSGTELRAFSGAVESAASVAFSPDGSQLAAVGWDQAVILWQVATGEARTLRRRTSSRSSVSCTVAFSSDGKYLAAGGANVTVWEVATAREVLNVKASVGPPKSAGLGWVPGYGYYADAKLLAEGSFVYQSLVGLTPDARYLALAAGHESDRVRILELATGKEARSLASQKHFVTSLAFSPDGAYFATGSREKAIKLWNVATGQEIRTLGGHASWVSSVAFSPDGRSLASADGQGTVKVWDVAAGRELQTLPGNTEDQGLIDTQKKKKKAVAVAGSVAFSPDGRWLASTSSENAIKLWQRQ